MELKTILGKESYVISGGSTELAVTRQGGHMAPVVFFKDSDRPIRPYFISPWQAEDVVPSEPVERVLRGDFFCMPCGLPKEFMEEGYPLHGETATGEWLCGNCVEDQTGIEIELFMDTAIRKGRVVKFLRLLHDHSAVYVRHTLQGYEGGFYFGHHATLSVPEKEQAVIVSTSPIRFGYTLPQDESRFSSSGCYYSLQPGKRFEELTQVPSIWKDKPFIDCSRHPTGTGFMDLLQIYNQPTPTPAWMTAYYSDDDFVWYALKDPQVLPAVVFWMENKGRYYSPWNGRTRGLGLEDVCVAIGDEQYNAGLRQDLDDNGITYKHLLSPEKEVVVNHVQGVTRVPKELGPVRTIEFSDGSMDLISQNDGRVTVEVDWGFITEK